MHVHMCVCVFVRMCASACVRHAAELEQKASSETPTLYEVTTLE
jgi:hypothetical protein